MGARAGNVGRRLTVVTIGNTGRQASRRRTGTGRDLLSLTPWSPDVPVVVATTTFQRALGPKGSRQRVQLSAPRTADDRYVCRSITRLAAVAFSFHPYPDSYT